MHVFVSIREPDHVPFYTGPIAALDETDHEVSVFVDDSPAAAELLRSEGISYTVLDGGAEPTRVENSRSYARRLYGAALRSGPDVITGIDSMRLPAVASLAGARPVAFLDDGVADARKTDGLCPTAVVTQDRPMAFGHRRNGHLSDALPYVLPDCFDPDPGRLADIDLDPTTPYFLIETDPDGTESSDAWADDVITHLSEFGRVYCLTPEGLRGIECESPELTPDGLHHFLALADLFVGRSSRLAREAGLVGTPALWTDPSTPGRTLSTLASYGLVDTCRSTDTTRERVRTLVPNPVATAVWDERHRQLLDDGYDETTYVLDVLGVETGTERVNSDAVSTARDAP